MTLCYRDTTFCASPGCKNECGRQITDQQRGEAQRTEMLVAWGYFCDLPPENYDSIKSNEAPE